MTQLFANQMEAIGPGGGVRPPLPCASSPYRPFQYAFTLAEVLFAIIVLGMGLILLAAAFPVGLAQNQKTQDTTMAGIVARMAFDQMTGVPSAGERPDFANDSWNRVTLPTAPANAAADRYAGRPLVMGLFDGIGGVSLAPPWPPPGPDLTLKIAYPYGNLPGNPSAPQQQDALTVPLLTESFLSLWGFRNAGTPTSPVWQENVQWVCPADRRYYWYAYYRQMYEQGMPRLFVPTDPQQLALFTRAQLDHITRRTYRVMIVICRVPEGQSPIPTPEQARTTLSSMDYAGLWGNLAPVPVGSDITGNVTTPWVADSADNGPISALISNGRVHRGGIVIDAWGQVYQIVDYTGSRVRLDRAIQIPIDATTLAPFPSPNGTINDSLPLWFDPNAIAVFPTIMTKQADMP